MVNMNDALSTIYSDWISQLKPENEPLYFGDDVRVVGVLPVSQEFGRIRNLLPLATEMSGSRDYVRLSLEYRGTKHNVDVAQKNGLWQKLGLANVSEKVFVVEGLLNVWNYGGKIVSAYKTSDELLLARSSEFEEYKNILKEQEKSGIKPNNFGVLIAEASTSDLKETIANIAKAEHEILNYITLLDIELNDDMFLVPMQVI